MLPFCVYVHRHALVSVFVPPFWLVSQSTSAVYHHYYILHILAHISLLK